MKILRFLRSEEGATAVEYSVMLILIVIAALVAIKSVGQQTASVWNDNNTGLQNAFNK